jgi:hypothetical protein
MTAYAKSWIQLVEPDPAEKWGEPPYLKGWRQGFSQVYSNNTFEIDTKSACLNKALAL